VKRIRSSLLLVALGSALACEAADEPAPASGDTPFGMAMGALGVELTDCTDAGGAFANATLTLNLAPGDDAIVSVSGGKLRSTVRRASPGAIGTRVVDSLAGLGESARDFTDRVRVATAEREAELRAELHLPADGSENLALPE